MMCALTDEESEDQADEHQAGIATAQRDKRQSHPHNRHAHIMNQQGIGTRTIREPAPKDTSENVRSSNGRNQARRSILVNIQLFHGQRHDKRERNVKGHHTQKTGHAENEEDRIFVYAHVGHFSQRLPQWSGNAAGWVRWGRGTSGGGFVTVLLTTATEGMALGAVQFAVVQVLEAALDEGDGLVEGVGDVGLGGMAGRGTAESVSRSGGMVGLMLAVGAGHAMVDDVT